MKKIVQIMFLILCLTVLNSWVFGQVYKFRAAKFAFKVKDDFNQWQEWSDWHDSSVLISIDINTKRIKIFSNKIQVYDIIEEHDIHEDDEGNKTLRFYCLDKNGLYCNVRVVVLKSGTFQVYVDYSDMMWVYAVNVLD